MKKLENSGWPPAPQGDYGDVWTRRCSDAACIAGSLAAAVPLSYAGSFLNNYNFNRKIRKIFDWSKTEEIRESIPKVVQDPSVSAMDDVD